VSIYEKKPATGNLKLKYKILELGSKQPFPWLAGIYHCLRLTHSRPNQCSKGKDHCDLKLFIIT
jgi:hypothetical protein